MRNNSLRITRNYRWPCKSDNDFELAEKSRRRRRRWGEYDVIGGTPSLICVVNVTLHCTRAESHHHNYNVRSPR